MSKAALRKKLASAVAAGPAKKKPAKKSATVKRNPEPPKQRQIEKAVQLFRNFTGREPEFFDEYKVEPLPKVGIVIGKLAGVMYDTIRDGKKEKYLHEFDKKSAPLLCSSFDGSQIFVVGGSYDFTEDGIVDRKPGKQ